MEVEEMCLCDVALLIRFSNWPIAQTNCPSYNFDRDVSCGFILSM